MPNPTHTNSLRIFPELSINQPIAAICKTLKQQWATAWSPYLSHVALKTMNNVQSTWPDHYKLPPDCQLRRRCSAETSCATLWPFSNIYRRRSRTLSYPPRASQKQGSPRSRGTGTVIGAAFPETVTMAGFDSEWPGAARASEERGAPSDGGFKVARFHLAFS